VYHPTHNKEINLEPKLTILNEKHWWRVGVMGPEPFHQEGKTSAAWAVVNDGDATVPHVTVPTDTASGADPPWFRYTAEIPFEWKQVDRAEKYEISLYYFKYAGNGYLIDWSNRVYFKEEPRKQDPNTNTQKFTIPRPDGSAPPDGKQVYGYMFSVRAVGPEGLKSPLDPIIAQNRTFEHGGPHLGAGVLLHRRTACERNR
jgi:hypothetical protein